MDESYSESDISMSPSQILERLHALRQLQLLQRGKLHKQRLEYQEASEASSSLTEIVSHFSNSISYNTFRSLLQSQPETSCDSPQLNTSKLSPKVNDGDLVEGISVLNLSRESEFIVSPTSTKSQVSVPITPEAVPQNKSLNNKHPPKKNISLDEMPILSPKTDFETLVLEKLKNDKNFQKPKSLKKDNELPQSKKPFLKRGEGMARFGVNKKDLIIQNTKSLPWRQNNDINSNMNQKETNTKKTQDNSYRKDVDVEIIVNDTKIPPKLIKNDVNPHPKTQKHESKTQKNESKTHNHNTKESSEETKTSNNVSVNSSHCTTETKSNQHHPPQKPVTVKHPLIQNKGKTWAAVLTKEQNDFLRQLKQSDYYKNFASPAKSTFSDVSYDDNMSRVRQEREVAEQNMFDMLESKVSHESFNLENSFFNRFLRKNKLECSGESTPLIMQKCLATNPQLLHIFPDLNIQKKNDCCNDEDTCNNEYTECCSDSCSTISCSCSCKTVEPADNTSQQIEINKNYKPKSNKKKIESIKENQVNDNVTETDNIKADMAEMNAKLIATSELLKDRLRELEDEIETFRKENSNLSKLREEVDVEKQKFYEEKAAFEQKFNEEKVLSEYYIAEEKEKLTKQKQMYERYVREIRGRLSKKEKDEVLNLKKEISDLKEEIRIKDAKSTSTIARLRNQLKIMEKEKKDLQANVEKLKKDNRRIQHSNEVTRRLTNIKYLEQINKKLNNMTTKETQSEVNLDSDVKYKAFEIERQSRSRRVVPSDKRTLPRAKSVPNLKVTSRYAKYFSQRDVVSQAENKTLNGEHIGNCPSDGESINDDPYLDMSGSILTKDSDSEPENNLEKLYTERFQTISPNQTRSSLTNTKCDYNNSEIYYNTDPFFIRKSNSSRDSRSPISLNTSPPPHTVKSNSIIRSKSPISILSHRSNKSPADKDFNPNEYLSSINGSNKSKSPITSVGNSLHSQNPTTVINKELYREKLMTVSPEPTSSKTSLSKTSLNPVEIKKSDGSKELRFPNGNVKYISADGKYSKFVYYNGDVKENFYNEGRIKYFYAETKTYHTTHADGLEVLEFPDGQVEKRYKDGSSEIRLPNGSIRYFDPKNEHVREEWRFPDGAALTVAASGEQRIVFPNGQIEVHAKDHKRREFPDGTVKLVYNDGTSETRYASGRVRIKDKHGNLIMDSAPG